MPDGSSADAPAPAAAGDEVTAAASRQDEPALGAAEELAGLPQPRRNELDSLETRAVTRELQVLVGGYLEKAYQPTRDEVLLRFRVPGIGRRDLYCRRGALLFFTTNAPPNPTKPSAFAMAIRKNVGGGKVFRVEQAGFDRVVTMWVQKRDGDWRVVFELFGDGNVILVRPDGRIFLPLVPEAWAARTLRPGHPYAPPPARDDPLMLDAAGFIAKAREGNRDLVRALAREVALGGPVAEEVVARAGIDKKTPVEEAEEEDFARLAACWGELSDEVLKGEPQGYLFHLAGRAVDAAAYRSVRFTREAEASAAARIEPVASFSAALDALFLQGRRAVVAAEEQERAQKTKTKLDRQVEAQEEAIGRFAREDVEEQRKGELLFAHYQEVERIRQELLAARREHDWEAIAKRVEAGRQAGNPDAQMIVRLEPAKGRVVLRLPDTEGTLHEVFLDITRNVTENAQASYDRAKTVRAKRLGAIRALASTRDKMAAAAQAAAAAESAAEEAQQRVGPLITADRHHWFEAFRWCYASTGELIAAGRDAATNDRIVKKHLAEGDRYVHADMHGAPSVVVKPAGDVISETALEEAARLATTWSRAFGQTGSADAYWVTPPQVSKTPEAGEYLARGAFIIRGQRNWLRRLPIEVAVGRVWLDREGNLQPPPGGDAQPEGLRAKLMAGPPSAVKAHADRWVVMVAGMAERRGVVKALARAFDAHPDPLERGLPTGAFALVEAKDVHVPEGTFGAGGGEKAAETGIPRRRRR